MCGPSPAKLTRAHPCALLGPACSTSHTWSFPSSSTMGISLPPGAVPCSRAFGEARASGLCRKRLAFVSSETQSERDDLNHAAGSRSRLRRGVWSHPCLFHPGLAECPPAALSIPTPHSAKDPGCGAGTPPPWCPSLPALLAPGPQVSTWERSRYLHPIVSQAREGCPGTHTIPGSRCWAPPGFKHSRNLGQRDLDHPTGQK